MSSDVLSSAISVNSEIVSMGWACWLEGLLVGGLVGWRASSCKSFVNIVLGLA